ncbi:MAG: hypothetical protein NZ700_02315, partial [Gemmataceae bacterium]|nr:hypothetical protein [Gemmataceae bacterium]MDW8265194.1 hypothetical protein [Gemmataceae bacterium]
MRCGAVWRCAWLLGLLASAAVPGQTTQASGKTVLSGESPRTARRLADAQRLVEQRQWADAIDEYQHILTEAGDDLVPVDGRQSVPARWLVHQRLASLPAEGLELYRARVDGAAAKVLAAAITDRDPALLRRVVDQWFASRPAQQALELLGELALESGDYEEAERWFRMLAGSAEDEGKEGGRPAGELIYPGPEVPLARVRAKALLARLYRGQRRNLADQLRAFRQRHGDAVGRLAGREGRLADLLEAWAAEAAPPLRHDQASGWPTFAGHPSRCLRPAVAPPFLRYDTSPLRVRLPDLPLVANDPEPGRGSTRMTPVLAYYPVIADNRVFLTDGGSIYAYQASSGREVGRYKLSEPPAMVRFAGLKRLPADAGFTLTVSGGYVYARLGSLTMGEPTLPGLAI